MNLWFVRNVSQKRSHISEITTAKESWVHWVQLEKNSWKILVGLQTDHLIHFTSESDYNNLFLYEHKIQTSTFTMDVNLKKQECVLHMQCCVHMILQSGLSPCQVFSGSEQNEKVRHSNRISQCDLFTPRFPLHHSILATLALGGTQESLGLQVLGFNSQGSHVLTISSVLCEIMQIF